MRYADDGVIDMEPRYHGSGTLCGWPFPNDFTHDDFTRILPSFLPRRRTEVFRSPRDENAAKKR